MNKQEAIEWCKSLEIWPRDTKQKAPEGWRWVVGQLPYQRPEFKLVNAKSEEIRKEDVKGV